MQAEERVEQKSLPVESPSTNIQEEYFKMNALIVTQDLVIVTEKNIQLTSDNYIG